MALKIALSMILRRVEFDLLSDPDPELEAAANLRPAEHIEMRVRKT